MTRRSSFLAALGAGLFAFVALSHAQQPKGNIGNITAEMGSVAIEGNVANSTINIGLTPEQLAALTRPWAELSDMQKKEIAKLEGELMLNQQQIRSALQSMGERNVPTEQLAATLVAIAQRFKDLDMSALTADVRTAVEAGELAKADDLLADIERMQKRVVGRFAANAADTAAQRAQIALTRLLYREAARHFADAASVLAAGDANEAARLSYLDKEADALFRQGDEFGDTGALHSAIERYRRLLELRPRERVPADWAATQTNLGRTLALLGDQEGRAERLKEAIVAFREALKERTREHMPLDWAETQSYLGAILARLGRVEKIERLDEAIAAFREILKESTLDHAPENRAKIQSRLGFALYNRGTDQHNIVLLEQAVSAFREASQQLTRERAPIDWAKTQFGLGFAFMSLGLHEDSAARLEASVEMFRAALQEWPHDRVPYKWATAEQGLGFALMYLGQRESGTARLEEAVMAFRNTLMEVSQERHPFFWAAMNEALGEALSALAQRESGTERLKEAIAAFGEALKIVSRRDYHGPPLWTSIATAQAAALRSLAARTHDLQTAKQALALATAVSNEVEITYDRSLIKRLRKR